MKAGLIARADNTGLGNLSWGLYENLKELFSKVVIINTGVFKIFPERFPANSKIVSRGSWNDKEVDDFLEDIDVVLAIETPYNWNVFPRAKNKKVISVMIPMFEGASKPLNFYPDYLLCPSVYDRKSFAGEPLKFIDCVLPVDTSAIKFREHTKAHTFVLNMGHGGIMGRTGIVELLEAIPLIQADIKFLIRSQTPIDYKLDDPRIDIRIGNVKNYWELWDEGDIYLHPSKQEMISMPVQEALAAGMPVLSSRFKIYEDVFPESWFFPETKNSLVKMHQREIRFHFHEPQKLADTIGQWANQDISSASRRAREIAETISWEKLRPIWLSLLRSLV